MPYRAKSLLSALLPTAALLTIIAGCATTRELGTQAAGPDSATLHVPYQFQVTALDDRIVREHFYTFDGRDQKITLAPGRHTVKLRYFDLINTHNSLGDDYARVLSAPISVQFTAEPDTPYAVVGPHPTTASAGEHFAAHPRVAIKTRANGRDVTTKISVAKPQDEGQAAANPGNDNTGDPATTAATVAAGATAQAGRSAGAATGTASPAPGQPGPAATAHAYARLQYWWRHAEPATRRRFRRWQAAH